MVTRRLKAVERELRDIKQSLKASNSQHQPGSKNNDDNPTAVVSSINSTIHQLNPQPDAEISGTDFLSSITSIDGVNLEPRLIKDLLNEFFNNYHSFWPILPCLSSFIKYSGPCPLLLWTVLVTALRGKFEHRELYLTIAEAVRNMAYDTIRPEYASFHSMQALLLLCHWPLPFQRNNDPSHSFIALATNIGLRMGLHRPRYAVEFVNESSTDGEMEVLRRKTWVVCFITNLSVSIQLGLPATVRLDQCLLEILAEKPPWLPDRLYCQLHMARQTFNICSTLGYCESSSTGLLPEPNPVIRMFETELRVLESRFSQSWSPTEYMVFFGCRMVLYTFALTAETLQNDSIQVEPPSHWLIQAYMISAAAIRTASSIRNQLIFTPTRLQKMIVNAVCFLLLLKCSRHYDLVDKSELSNGISQGWETVQGLSITTGDIMSRACLLIERLSQYSDTLEPQDKAKGLLLVKSRMGANISLSSILRAKEFSKKTQDETVLNDEEESTDVLNADDMSLFADLDWDVLFSDMAV
ncbi:hypothetical protein B7463_g1298, partial [Scytalidium lignicola]